MKPNPDLSIDCYVDADFAGLYGQELAMSYFKLSTSLGVQITD
jgi:hypothetical protein